MSLISGTAIKAESPQPAGVSLWAFGGGKGGIGKSFLTSNIAVCLAQTGHSVTLVDLDFGGANLHSCVGADLPRIGLSDFLNGNIPSLNDLAIDTKISRLKLVTGVNDAFSPAQINEKSIKNLIQQLRQIQSRFVFVDLGAGASEVNAEFFLAADQSVLVSTPEPTSVENTYQYLKMVFHRKVRAMEKKFSAQELIHSAMENRVQNGIRTPNDLIKYLMRVEPKVGAAMRSEIDKLRFKLLLNQVRTRTDIDLGYSIKSVCRNYFGISVDFAAHLDFDNAAWQASRKRQPLVVSFPYSHLSGKLFNIAKSLVDTRQNSVIL